MATIDMVKGYAKWFTQYNEWRKDRERRWHPGHECEHIQNFPIIFTSTKGYYFTLFTLKFGFFRECSQKLAAWQEEIESTRKNFGLKSVIKSQQINSILARSHLRSADHTNSTKKITTYKIKSARTEIIKETTTNVVQSTSTNKDKKKSKLINKMVQTTELFTRLTKTSNLTTKTKSVLIVDSQPKQSQLKPPSKTPIKFKTGGIVATAVQPNKKINKKVRASTAIPIRSTSRNNNTTSDNSSESENLKSFVRKVKSKIKKKKTKV